MSPTKMRSERMIRCTAFRYEYFCVHLFKREPREKGLIQN